MKIVTQQNQWPFNLLYWIIFPLVLMSCYWLSKQIITDRSQLFYGFTDTKETQLSANLSSFVDEVHVLPGQPVKKGDTLVTLEKTAIDKDIRSVEQSLIEINEKKQMTNAEINASIEKIKSENSQKLEHLKSEITVEKSKIAYVKEMLNPNIQISSMDHTNPSAEKIAMLENEIIQLKKATEKLLASYDQVKVQNQSANAEAKKLSIDREYLIASKNKLYIIAPFDGIIGNVNCKQNEYISSQTSLISFYESSPSLVQGYVHESLILKVKIGDSLIVESILQPGHPVRGIIVGKGHRIIEIPERLRKIPEYKTYGMEIYVNIPVNNSLLQKEMVKIQIVP